MHTASVMRTPAVKEERMDIRAFWNDIVSQNRDALASWFCEDAVIRWHCTNEQFNVEEYVRANCDYPGEWCGDIERIEESGDTMILAGKVYPPDDTLSYHVVSFIRLRDGRIAEMDEYWADDGEVPYWRKNMGIGKPLSGEAE